MPLAAVKMVTNSRFLCRIFFSKRWENPLTIIKCLIFAGVLLSAVAATHLADLRGLRVDLVLHGLAPLPRHGRPAELLGALYHTGEIIIKTVFYSKR